MCIYLKKKIKKIGSVIVWFACIYKKIEIN